MLCCNLSGLHGRNVSIREEEVETCSPAPINWNQPVITDVGSGVMISGFVCVSFLESGLEFNEVIRLCIIRKCSGGSFRKGKMMTAAVTAPFWSLLSCSLLPCQGLMQWKRNEKVKLPFSPNQLINPIRRKRFSRKVAFITAGFELKPPPYPLERLERSRDALEPHMSRETLDYHWGKHHKTYVENLNKQIVGTDLDGLSLEEVVLLSYNRGNMLPAFNKAAKVLVTRHGSLSCGYLSWIALSQLRGAYRSLTVARIDLSRFSRSFDSLSCSYSAQIALLRLLVMDSSLAVTWRRSFSRSRSDRSLAVTRLTLLQLLGTDRSLAVTRHGSLSRSHSSRIALSQSLGLLARLEHDVIPRRHVHLWRFDCDGSLMANTVLTDRSRNHPGAWNHEFFWESIQPGGGGKPSGYLLRLIERDFGSFDDLLERFKAAAASNFGSGWTWLAYKANRLDVANAINPLPKEEDKTLVIVKTPNAVNPLVWDYS
ncbi:hypothetical protein DY000_02016354, partial [Brassica cretica]